MGGRSLFGGRGKVIHGVLGGLLIGAIDNGMYLQNYHVPRIFVVTGLVLLAAVSIDTLSRRAASSGTAARGSATPGTGSVGNPPHHWRERTAGKRAASTKRRET